MAYSTAIKVTCTGGDGALAGEGKVYGAVEITCCIASQIVSRTWSTDDFARHNMDLGEGIASLPTRSVSTIRSRRLAIIPSLRSAKHHGRWDRDVAWRKGSLSG